MTKQPFWVDVDSASAIDDDAGADIAAANFRYCADLHELELAFEAKASALREAFLTETTGIQVD